MVAEEGLGETGVTETRDPYKSQPSSPKRHSSTQSPPFQTGKLPTFSQFKRKRGKTYPQAKMENKIRAPTESHTVLGLNPNSLTYYPYNPEQTS